MDNLRISNDRPVAVQSATLAQAAEAFVANPGKTSLHHMMEQVSARREPSNLTDLRALRRAYALVKRAELKGQIPAELREVPLLKSVFATAVEKATCSYLSFCQDNMQAADWSFIKGLAESQQRGNSYSMARNLVTQRNAALTVANLQKAATQYAILPAALTSSSTAPKTAALDPPESLTPRNRKRIARINTALANAARLQEKASKLSEALEKMQASSGKASPRRPSNAKGFLGKIFGSPRKTP